MTSYRDYQSTSYNASSSSGGGGGGGGIETDFTKLSQTVANSVQKISNNVNQMQRMVNQLGTSQDNETLRQTLHQIQHYTNQLARDTNKSLKELAHIPGSTVASEQKQRRMQKERLTNEFSEALKNFQVIQRTAAQKEKESVIRARANSGFNDGPTGRQQSTLIDLQSPQSGQSGAFPLGPSHQQHQSQIQIEEEVDVSMLREREQAIRKIESDIVEVNQIFKDLATMVHDQGEVIDSIEANIESSSVQINEGTQQLIKASSYAQAARKKKFMIILILFIVLMVIVGIVYISSR